MCKLSPKFCAQATEFPVSGGYQCHQAVLYYPRDTSCTCKHARLNISFNTNSCLLGDHSATFLNELIGLL